MTTKILIATPVRGANVWSASVTVGYSEHRCLATRMYDAEFCPSALTFATDNIRARNRIASYVMAEMPHVTHVLWWDDDQWPTDMGVIRRMIDADEDFIAAPYTTKEEAARWVHVPLDPSNPVLDSRGFLECSSVGFGFTMTSRACLEKVGTAGVQYWDTTLQKLVPNRFGQLLDVRDPRGHGAPTLLSEDHSFCKRWRDMGGRIWIDGRQGNMIEHAGTKVYDGRDVR